MHLGAMTCPIVWLNCQWTAGHVSEISLSSRHRGGIMFSPDWSNIPIAWPEAASQREIPSIPSHTAHTGRATDGLKKQKHYQQLRSSYSLWACARTGSKGFTYTKFWGKKKMRLWVWNLASGCSLFQFEQKENYIIATYSCCEAKHVF